MSELTIIKKEFYEVIQDDFVSQSGLSKEVFQKEVSFAVQILRGNPYMQKCTGNSVLKAVLNVAQTGLSLNPVLKYAYLVPRSVKRDGKYVLEACLDPSYIGLAKLLTDTGSVTSLSTQIVYEGDVIEINLGSDEKVTKHTPYILAGNDKGAIKAVYSLAQLPDGTKHIEFMSYEDILDIRDRSESYKSFKAGKSRSCIWDSDESEMCRKTVIKRHTKYLPKSEKFEKVGKAIDVDNNLNGFSASDNKIDYMLELIRTAEIEPHEKVAIEDWVFEMTDIEADKNIAFLLERQPQDLYTQKGVVSATSAAIDKDEAYERKNKEA